VPLPPAGGSVSSSASTDAGVRIEKLDAELEAAETQLDELMLRIPNPADPDVPVVTSRQHGCQDVGELLPKEVTADGSTWTRRPHWEVAKR